MLLSQCSHLVRYQAIIVIILNLLCECFQNFLDNSYGFVSIVINYRHGVTDKGKEALQVPPTQSAGHHAHHDVGVLFLGPQQGVFSAHYQGYRSYTNRYE